MPFQLTTSRRGRPAYCCATSLDISVSTHDLTKRSTGLIFYRRLTETVSTHDLTKRSTTILQRAADPGSVSTHDLTKRSTEDAPIYGQGIRMFQLTTSRRGRQQFLRKKFSFQNHFLCSLHIIYSYYINTIFFSTLFLAKSSFFLVRIL